MTAARSRRFVQDDRLYLTDNGAVLCGAHCGTSAATTGRDISGQRIELVTDDHAVEWRRMAGSEIQCERCGKRQPISVAHTSVRGHAYPGALRTFEKFTDASWGNDITDSVTLVASGRPLLVWVEHENPAERSTDFGWDPGRPISDSNRPAARFTVCALDPKCDPDERQIADEEPLLETDDPDALIAFLRGPR